MKAISIAAIFILMWIASPCITNIHAVEPPSVEEREKAADSKKKHEQEELSKQRKSGCPYGKDAVTGKCYEPKEGQFYRDPNTGEIKTKKVTKWNFPWSK